MPPAKRQRKRPPSKAELERRQAQAAEAAGDEPKKLDLNELPLVAVIATGREPAVHLNGIDAYAAPTMLRKAATLIERDLGVA